MNSLRTNKTKAFLIHGNIQSLKLIWSLLHSCMFTGSICSIEDELNCRLFMTKDNFLRPTYQSCSVWLFLFLFIDFSFNQIVYIYKLYLAVVNLHHQLPLYLKQFLLLVTSNCSPAPLQPLFSLFIPTFFPKFFSFRFIINVPWPSFLMQFQSNGSCYLTCRAGNLPSLAIYWSPTILTLRSSFVIHSRCTVMVRWTLWALPGKKGQSLTMVGWTGAWFISWSQSSKVQSLEAPENEQMRQNWHSFISITLIR